jgi:hypothetical protein
LRWNREAVFARYDLGSIGKKRGPLEILSRLRGHAQQAGGSAPEVARATSDAGDVPGIAFVAETERRPLCNGALKVYKSRSRQVITLAGGSFRAIETLRHRGIALSTGSLSALCDRFLSYLEALHLTRVPQLRSALGESYPLHIDATCEHGKGGLFLCVDAWRGRVLVAGRIPSKHEDHLRPLVEKTTPMFGDPIAIVRDMGQGGAKALAPLREKGRRRSDLPLSFSRGGR